MFIRVKNQDSKQCPFLHVTRLLDSIYVPSKHYQVILKVWQLYFTAAGVSAV